MIVSFLRLEPCRDHWSLFLCSLPATQKGRQLFPEPERILLHALEFRFFGRMPSRSRRRNQSLGNRREAAAKDLPDGHKLPRRVASCCKRRFESISDTLRPSLTQRRH